mgnify:CR=1 FL=1
MLRVTKVDQLAPAGYTVPGWRVTDIARLVRGLAAAEVAFQRYPGREPDELGIWTTPDHGRIAWSKDPDGNTLSLTEFAA